eukprot:TRINITY_DN9769_c0_g1_i6.p1 TRINITY_DN9769_c0_g1~~TRINITY_DN9769_c0_g1_i6.p1  ORF type:complete len:442 (+),score=17.18 TRINITY_DN9769_c0_g1_i6:105-1430(+)
MVDSSLVVNSASYEEKEILEQPEASNALLNEPLNSASENNEIKDNAGVPSTHLTEVSMRDTWWRFAFLGVCCLTLMGSYYCYDTPAPVQKMINAPVKKGTIKGVEHGMSVSSFQYQLLYSLYSLPNIFIPLFGEFFISYLGRRSGIIMFCAAVAVGQFFFALSARVVQSSENFGKFLVFLGRFVLGLGGETLNVAAVSFLTVWFKGRELLFALGSILCTSRIFTVINDVTQPKFYTTSDHKLSLGFWFGFILCLVSLGCAIILVMIDSNANQPPILNTEASAIDNAKSEDTSKAIIKLSDINKLPRAYWILTGSCMFTYMSFMTCMNVASGMLQERFAVGLETAGLIMAIPYAVAAAVTPLFECVLDTYGVRSIARNFALKWSSDCEFTIDCFGTLMFSLTAAVLGSEWSKLQVYLRLCCSRTCLWSLCERQLEQHCTHCG